MKRLIFLCITLVLSACASEQKSFAWEAIKASPAPFNDAYAKCEYDMQILGKDNQNFKYQLLGMQHPTFEACMKTMGYAWIRQK